MSDAGEFAPAHRLAATPLWPEPADASAAEAELGTLFEGLVERLEPRIRRFLHRSFSGPAARGPAEIDDLVQEVFVHVWRAMLAGRVPERVDTWVFVVARNVGLDLLRRTSVRRAARQVLEDERAARERREEARSARRAEGAAVDAEFRVVLNEAIEDMPEPYRTTFVLREQEGLELATIASITEVAVKTVSSRLARARAFLRNRFVAAGLHPARDEDAPSEGSPA